MKWRILLEHSQPIDSGRRDTTDAPTDPERLNDFLGCVREAVVADALANDASGCDRDSQHPFAAAFPSEFSRAGDTSEAM
ncbi:hypothetical protein [Glaciibacter superstes]|uniref:hypothetical protein n=1 Tax=Glaciibacter superstes TaxID=501023 RepID=UPI0012FC8E5B|nr:hypothetical protein [Glaciibacter superstes]